MRVVVEIEIEVAGDTRGREKGRRKKVVNREEGWWGRLLGLCWSRPGISGTSLQGVGPGAAFSASGAQQRRRRGWNVDVGMHALHLEYTS